MIELTNNSIYYIIYYSVCYLIVKKVYNVILHDLFINIQILWLICSESVYKLILNNNKLKICNYDRFNID